MSYDSTILMHFERKKFRFLICKLRIMQKGTGTLVHIPVQVQI
jgi:hypothetical protein